MSDQIRALCEIKEFNAFLEKCLKRKVLHYTLKPLTKPGDNYGSIMQSVDVKVAKEFDQADGEDEVLHLVSKCAVTNPYLIEIFQPAFTFIKETHFYSDIIPAIEMFEIMRNVPTGDRIDAFIQCTGSRISLNPNVSSADSDAVLLLENMKYRNYINEDRHIGFDTETTLEVLKTLARFHAICIAIRRIQPKLFDAKISPHLKAVNLNPDDDDTTLVDNICNELNFVDDLNEEMRTKIEEQLIICDKFGRDTTRTPDTPYTTIIHRDLWTSNIMIKRDDVDGKTVKVKIYDFQLYFYQSFVCDLIFFLFTSVRCNDLTKNFQLFVYHYYLEFIKTMKLVNCPRDDYTYDKMWKEVKEKAKLELLHSLFMIKIVSADENSTPSSLDEFKPDTFCTNESLSKAILNRWKCIFSVCNDNGLL